MHSVALRVDVNGCVWRSHPDLCATPPMMAVMIAAGGAMVMLSPIAAPRDSDISRHDRGLHPLSGLRRLQSTTDFFHSSAIFSPLRSGHTPTIRRLRD
jgi:hypothetical protein